MSETSFGAGLAVLIVGGILGGCWATPSKWMQRYQFEQWLFVMALGGQLVLPWGVSFLLCPHLTAALSTVPLGIFVRANLFSVAWGIANTLFGLCLARIGFSLTIGIMTGVGLPLGVIVPMILKGSGRFADAPAPASLAGMIILGATVVMLAGVFLAARAGYEREQTSTKLAAGRFSAGLMMAVAIGILQTGLAFAFVYSQGPIIAALTGRGAGATGASLGVWAATMPGGALVNLVFAGYLMSRKASWHTLAGSRRDFLLGLLLSLGFFLIITCLGLGMRLMGPLGASVGFGVVQSLQIISAQIAGVAFGEWKAAGRQLRRQMALAVGLMLAGVVIMALAKNG